MDSPTQQPYLDSPTSSPTPRTSPSPSDAARTTKPLPSLPPSATPPTYTPNEPTSDAPYRDDPPSPSAPPQNLTLQQHLTPHHQEQIYIDSPPLTPNDDNIPLAHFLAHQYPAEAPPSYSVAVRQTQSTRDTLIQYIPSNQHTPSARQQHRRNVVIEIDEETGEVVSRTDDVRHSMEKVVAMFIVAIVLLVLSGVLAWMAFGMRGMW